MLLADVLDDALGLDSSASESLVFHVAVTVGYPHLHCGKEIELGSVKIACRETL